MVVIKRPLHGAIQAITDRNHFTQTEFHEALVENQYIGPFDFETSAELWESQLILIEVSKLLPVKTMCKSYTETNKAA